MSWARKGEQDGRTSAKTAVTQHAIFFQCFSTCYFFFNMLFFSCMIFNMLDSAGPFFNMLFHCLNMPFFRVAISTCYIHHHHFINMPFQHARFCWTIFQHAVSCIEHAFGSCSNFNMLYSSPPIFNMSFQHARICWTFFQHAVSFIEHAIVF